MTSRKLSAGDNIEATCTRCRAVLNHTIVAMVGDRVVRVECNTCKGMHNFHAVREERAKERKAAGAGPVVKKETPSRAKKKDPGAIDREEWEALQPTINPDRVVRYDMSGIYRLNDTIDHPVFGLGVVKTVIPPNKVEVLFQPGRKLLRTGSR